MVAISVVIPAFRPNSFDALARSMKANVAADAEWIVVDDGSGAEFDAIFSTLPSAVQLIRLPEKRRQAAARNAGLAQAQGKWVKFLDADDELDQGHLAALLDRVEQDNTIPFAPTKHVFANGSIYVNDSWRDLRENAEAQFRRQLVRPFFSHCGALFPRELLDRLGGYDESLITDEDGDLILRILHEGYHFTPVVGVHYLYIHQDGQPRVSADDDIRKLQSRVRVCDKVEATFSGHMTPGVALALAQRIDKIAMSYWTAFPAEAKALVARAHGIAPGYAPDIRGPLRLVRRIGGPGMVFAVQGLYRNLKGRPKGGAQG
ncbi:glycosyltransferase family 2 protein [Aliiruegeria lutimaris]|uniref:Glycosyl transferase family 2 n=1 Tax=Aliiruegeria lutimaris TaxID=571298 RepID=A0A1G9N7F5_9RHOB|nr:glycosyltransferase family 2 protein [Aliiruegeria lutimaris]SDL82231.1 Glycosyl transferase family 2 [Aliiruegeria lutimaris]